MEWVESTGRSIDDAKEAALDRLGVHEDDAEFDVLTEAKVGLFGRVKEDARVRARVRPTAPRAKDERRRERGRGRDRRPGSRGGKGDRSARDQGSNGSRSDKAGRGSEKGRGRSSGDRGKRAPPSRARSNDRSRDRSRSDARDTREEKSNDKLGIAS